MSFPDCLPCVIVSFPGHTHTLFSKWNRELFDQRVYGISILMTSLLRLDISLHVPHTKGILQEGRDA